MKAIITGITGQDGYYLSKLLLEKGYEIHGLIRRSSSFNTKRIDELIAKYGTEEKLFLYYSDLLDSSSLNNLINTIEPDEVYNLAAQSHVAVSFKNPLYTTQTSTIGPLTILEAIKNSSKKIRYYQASSSEMFGGIDNTSLNEESKFVPKSPYAVGKLFAHEMSKVYRESYDIFAVNGILFNHESPMRGETFVTRKISKAVGRISQGIQTKLTLGNIDAFRDWGFAGDYVKGMYLMMQHDKPDDWVLSSDETHTVKEFLEIAFSRVNLNWEDFVITSEKYQRPNEVEHLLGDSSKARKILNWKPEVSFNGLVEMMVDYDIKEATREKLLLDQNLLTPTWEHPV
ncbi:GDP-mannose 4,6-dehydratase [Acidimicrobiia bacterium]|jgi:GDPmannose 4,6-dehydratase|nr:GDP-mannose 4,6-dehydratase [Acidimicrobiia bacterium]|tara:strand:+ start:186 stop:1214 length:1029 start_codon:yes stop_codon:yes gene_type:complete